MAEGMELCQSEEKSLKRRFSEDQTDSRSESFPTPPLTASPKQDANNRELSPALSTSTLSSVATSTQQETPVRSESSAPPQKRKKLSPAEKELQRAEKEQKMREKEELKAKKEEEKRIKDEERRKKKEEKEAKDREKELEKQRKENEKLKKERSQPKLASFFAKPKLPAPVSHLPTDTTSLDMGRRKSLSIEPGDEPIVLSQSTPKPRDKAEHRTDYERKFLPFQLPSHTTLAPYLPESDSDVDDLLNRILNQSSSSDGPGSVSSFFANHGKARGLWQPNVREIMDNLDGSASRPVDLTDDMGEVYRPEDLLSRVTIRQLNFAEDVRPPYLGSYTKSFSPKSSAKLRRNPFSKIRKDTNYDYDSEAEWEEPEEGEDIFSDGEDDEESVGAPDEMEDFLDEDEGGPKRRLITGDLKPISTDLCWEDCSATAVSQGLPVDLNSMKLEFFLELPQPSINPFSCTYWPEESARASAVLASSDAKPVVQVESGKLVSPRPPLQPRLSANGAIIGASSGEKGPIMVDRSIKIARPAAQPLGGRDLEEFREAIVGSNVPKTDLLRALKKRFPKFTNDTIKSTLTERFHFSGSSRAEKTWTFVG